MKSRKPYNFTNFNGQLHYYVEKSTIYNLTNNVHVVHNVLPVIIIVNTFYMQIKWFPR